MGFRSRLLVVALGSSVLTGIVGIAGVLPVVHALRAELQARYDAAAAFPEAARTVTTEYYQAAVWTLVAVAVALFCAGAAYVAATTPPGHRPAVPRDLGRLGGALLLAQLPLSLAADLWGSYSPAATVGGLALGAAGAAVLLLERGPRSAYVVGCLVAAAATLVVAEPAVLLLPVSTGVAGLLAAAAVTTGQLTHRARATL